MTYTMICPKCVKSREFYEVREQDPKTKKFWMVTRCRVCAFNIDIVESKLETRIAKTKPEPPSGPWKPFYG
jgi:hypothetical protein